MVAQLHIHGTQLYRYVRLIVDKWLLQMEPKQARPDVGALLVRDGLTSVCPATQNVSPSFVNTSDTPTKLQLARLLANAPAYLVSNGIRRSRSAQWIAHRGLMLGMSLLERTGVNVILVSVGIRLLLHVFLYFVLMCLMLFQIFL